MISLLHRRTLWVGVESHEKEVIMDQEPIVKRK